MQVKTGSKGFSLLEMLLAVSLFSIAAASLYTFFFHGMRLQRESAKMDTVYGDLRLADALLTADLENMVNWTDSQSQLSLVQAADAGLQFVKATKTGLKAVRYFLREPERKKIHTVLVNTDSGDAQTIHSRFEEALEIQELAKSECPLAEYLAGKGEPCGEASVLSTLAVPDSLKFSFAFQSKGSTEITWKDMWDGSGIPLGVRWEVDVYNPDSPGEVLHIQRDVFIPSGHFGGRDAG